MRNINIAVRNSCYVRSHKAVHIDVYAFVFILKMFIRKPDDGARWHKYVAYLHLLTYLLHGTESFFRS